MTNITSENKEGWYWELPLGESKVIMLSIMGSPTDMMGGDPVMDQVIAALPTDASALMPVDISGLDTAEKRLTAFNAHLSGIVALLNHYLPGG